MCLAVPGQIHTKFEADGVPMGEVDFGGVRRRICLVYTPEAGVGDYVLVHAGFAINRIDEQAAQASLDAFAQLEESLAPAVEGQHPPE
ncbi:MAG: HypC/HybG/HupF family hydrogenase formation chaperone [Planctomycetaceae bacterium]|nr:HypC/HybG/HupF family hydrogenase formation chaperone [Planctomycetaceae bacterium]